MILSEKKNITEEIIIQKKLNVSLPQTTFPPFLLEQTDPWTTLNATPPPHWPGDDGISKRRRDMAEGKVSVRLYGRSSCRTLLPQTFPLHGYTYMPSGGGTARRPGVYGHVHPSVPKKKKKKKNCE